MFLSEVLEQLTYGELAEMSIGGKRSGGIGTEDYPAIVAHINMAMTELYKRFNLKMGEIRLMQQENVTMYKLSSEFAVMNMDSVNPYIDDSIGFPFEDDLLKIEEIFDELGEPVGLNDPNDDDSLYTPRYDTIKIPYANVLNTLIVTYRAAPERIVATDLNPQTTDIALPISLLEALVFYIAHRIHSNVPSVAGDAGEGMRYLAKFEASCKKVEELGLINIEEPTITKFTNRGFA